MRAIVRQAFGGPEQLVLREVPDPQPEPGQLVIAVKAFGLNHAEIYFRSGAWGEVPAVSGIECVRVIATTRNAQRTASLAALGAAEVEIDAPDLAQRIRARYPRGLDAVLDLVGNSTIRDSLAIVRPDGHVCLAGFLGGGAPIADFDPLHHMPSGVQLSFFGSFTFGGPDYPLS